MDPNFRRAFRLDRRSRADARASVEEELAFHLEGVAEELVAEGWGEEEARLEALRRFGDFDETRAYCANVQARRGREERTAMSFDELLQDVRYATRTIRRAPTYAALVVLTLAFGIAANTTIFSVMNPFLFRALPYDQPEELVQINQVNPVTGWDMDRFSFPQYEDWKARSRAFAGIGAYAYGSSNVTGPEGPERIQYSLITANLFPVLGVEPVVGRNFTSAEGQPGGDRVVLVSEALWQRRYGGDPTLVGRPITMDGVQRTVVGIMPTRFNFPFGSAKMWLPIREGASASRDRSSYILVGRLNPGWSPERARAELTQIQRDLGTQYPQIDGRMSGVTVKHLREALNFAWDMLSISFTVLLGAVAFVLLIACVNVASLTLARGSGRTREIAVRASIGARRGRIVRQLLTESLILALAGGAVGVLLAYLATGLIGPVLPEDLYRIGDIDIDGTVLAFSLLITLLTVVAFGLMPALTASRVNLTESLKEGAKGSGGVGSTRGRRVLVVAQVALAVVLTTGAGLMLRSLASVQNVDLGFDADRIVVTEVSLPESDYPTSEERLAFVDRAIDALSRTPGVVSTSAVRWLPLNNETMSLQVTSADRAGAPSEEWPLATRNDVHPRYLSTMGIDLLEGREFTGQDRGDSQPVVLVNRSLADRFWAPGEAVGKTLLGGSDPADPVTYTVVGVVADVRHMDISGDGPGPQIYRSTLQGAGRRYFLVARTEARPESLVSPVRQTMLREAEDLPVDIRPMMTFVRQSQLQWSIGTGFLSVFGAGALLLAALGIYGLVSYSVAQRRKEMRVRIALGASRRHIRRTVVSDGLRLTAVGLVVGLVAAVGLARLTASTLYGVSPFDPATLAGVLALFLVVSAAASLVPAARASRTDPIHVLRSE
jgi:predicted permease